MPDGGEMTNVELCRRYGIPIHRTCGLTTRQILNYHNRKKKKAFSLGGKTATLAEWGKALNISPHNISGHCVFLRASWRH